MLDRTALSSEMYFSVFFDGPIVTISMVRSTRFCLDVSATLSLLSSVSVCAQTLLELLKQHMRPKAECAIS